MPWMPRMSTMTECSLRRKGSISTSQVKSPSESGAKAAAQTGTRGRNLSRLVCSVLGLLSYAPQDPLPMGGVVHQWPFHSNHKSRKCLKTCSRASPMKVFSCVKVPAPRRLRLMLSWQTLISILCLHSCVCLFELHTVSLFFFLPFSYIPDHLPGDLSREVHTDLQAS